MTLGVALIAGAAKTGPGPSGSAELFTSPEPLTVQVRDLIARGEPARAEQLLGTHSGGGDSTEDRAVAEGRDIIRRLRLEYSQTGEELLAKLRESISDVTADDLEKWRRAGQVQYRELDGRIGYFRREPSNIFRFCEEARSRRREPSTDEAPAKKRLIQHTRAVIEAATTSGRADVLPIRHRIRYQVTVLPNRPSAKAGSLARCWLPFPQSYRQQGKIELIATDPLQHVVAPPGQDGREITGAAQRTVYLEKRIEDPAQPLTFREEFAYTSSAYYPALRDDKASPLGDTDGYRTYLDERPPHIVFTPEIRATAQRVVGDETNPLARARRIYEFVDSTVRYCAEEEYCLIPSFSLKALTSKRGDCGVQSMLFITLCRAAGIPARWQSGWETKPGDWNMHDWAEFYVEPWGWLPADVSYGYQNDPDPAVRTFFFGHIDSYRLIVNLDYGRPLVPPKTSLRSEPADFQRGEVELDGVNLYFDEWDYQIEFDWKDGSGSSEVRSEK